MNIGKGAAIGVVGITLGVGLTLGANAIGQWYTALRQDIRLAASKNAQPSQPIVSVSSPSASTTLISASAPVSFEALSPCEQLDSIARSGKSVAEFLVASANVNDLAKYQAAIASICPWNAEQLQVADRVLNPPVIVAAPVVTVSSGSSSGGSSGRSSGVLQPAPAWNNCNGVQEPGESYSARCETAQEMNDAGIGNSWSQRVDNRLPWRPNPGSIDPGFGRPPGGREGPANGYSAN